MVPVFLQKNNGMGSNFQHRDAGCRVSIKKAVEEDIWMYSDHSVPATIAPRTTTIRRYEGSVCLFYSYVVVVIILTGLRSN